MIMVEADHIEIHNTCDIELECFVDHIKGDTTLNLAWIFQKSFFVDVGREEVVLELRCDRELDILTRATKPLDRFV